MSGKIRIKVGNVEVEYEGDFAFLREDLPTLLTKLSELPVARASGSSIGGSNAAAQLSAGGAGTTGAIAGRLNCSEGADLVLAAGANLTLNKNKPTFSRKELLNEMKDAPTYYKETYSKNLSFYLRGLVKSGKFNELGKDSYAVTEPELKSLASRLGQ